MSAPFPLAFFQGLGAAPADWMNTTVQTVLNVAQLRTFSGLPNMQAQMLGTTTPGDGGGGALYWNAGATAPDNGTTVIRASGSAVGAWLRLGYYSTQSAFSGVYISQLKQGLASADPTRIVGSSIPADPYNAVTIGWTGSIMTVGSALYAFVQAALGYSSAQMTVFYNLCATYPVNP
jgi:hypothetical protein